MFDVVLFVAGNNISGDSLTPQSYHPLTRDTMSSIKQSSVLDLSPDPQWCHTSGAMPDLVPGLVPDFVSNLVQALVQIEEEIGARSVTIRIKVFATIGSRFSVQCHVWS